MTEIELGELNLQGKKTSKPLGTLVDMHVAPMVALIRE